MSYREQVYGPGTAHRWVHPRCWLIHPTQVTRPELGSGRVRIPVQEVFLQRLCSLTLTISFIHKIVTGHPSLQSFVEILGGWGRWGKSRRPSDNHLLWMISAYFCYFTHRRSEKQWGLNWSPEKSAQIRKWQISGTWDESKKDSPPPLSFSIFIL